MANLIFCLSLIFSAFLLTHARMVRFPSEETPLLPSAKPGYSNVFVIPKTAPSISSESHAVRETQRSDAVATVPLHRPAVMSFDLSFRPINPRLPPFPLTDPRPLRPRRHRCHHRHPIRGPHFRVPYGDDMIADRGGMHKGSRGELGTVVTMGAEQVRRPEGQREGEEGRLRSWLWNIINGF